jgi:hypothetical protein
MPGFEIFNYLSAVLMANIGRLLSQIANRENALLSTRFLAPCLPGAMAQTRVAGMIYRFMPQPRDFEGWAIFQPVNEKIASIIEEASLPLIAQYLRLFKPLRLRLAYALAQQTWLAYPGNESDARQRFGASRPVKIHLVSDGEAFEQIIARWDGDAWWFEEIDRRADPLIAEQLRAALKALTPEQNIRIANITPEAITAYQLAARQAQRAREKAARKDQQSYANSDEARLQKALRFGGGVLRGYKDRGAYWVVEWTTRDGQRHASAIEKKNLTVMSAGICLSGRDNDFDLQSLVKIVEQR